MVDGRVGLDRATESDCSSPNGLPMAATGAPTCRSLVEPSGSGRSVRPLGSIFSSATSAKGSKPFTWAGTWLPSAKRTKTFEALRMSGPSPLVTTWALVAISPVPESTKPEPRPAALLLPGAARPVAMTVTTPGDSRS